MCCKTLHYMIILYIKHSAFAEFQSFSVNTNSNGKVKNTHTYGLVVAEFLLGGTAFLFAADYFTDFVCIYLAFVKFSRICILSHTYATRAVEAGVNFKFLSSLLGHASIKTTLDRYAHTTNDSMLQAVQQFENKMKEIMA